MKKIVILLMVSIFAFASTYPYQAWLSNGTNTRINHYKKSNKYYNYQNTLRNGFTTRVNVLYTKPIYRTVTVKTPYQECWDVQVQGNQNRTAGSIIGGVAGGILGHQIGGGSGKTAATIGGAIIGTMVGTNLSNNDTSVRQRCRTTYTSTQEERLVGYKNYAQYRGHKIIKISSRQLQTIIIHISW